MEHESTPRGRHQLGVHLAPCLAVLATMVGPTTLAADAGSATLNAPAVDAHDAPYAPDRVLVRFRATASAAGASALHAAIGASVERRLSVVPGLEVVALPPGVSVPEALERYRAMPEVLYAEADFIYRAAAMPNDPRRGELWALRNTCPKQPYTSCNANCVIGADIDAVPAWDITTGSRDVIVTVIDTGIDYNHPDLAANMWRNEADCDRDGVDDDGNGTLDDCHGIDTINNDSDPIDDHYHGTHVAGTIGAAGNDAVGVVGVNWQVRLMACKFLSAGGWGYTSGAVACLDYVARMADRGVRVRATNNSWGGSSPSRALSDAILEQLRRGILFIAAAGNSWRNTESDPAYPANYDLPNVLSIAASGMDDQLTYFSNRGRTSTHLAAPGCDTLSTAPGNTYRTLSGTSMAAPHVTGVAALLAAQDGSRDWRALRNLLLAGGQQVAGLAGKVATERRLDALGALTCSSRTVQSRLKPAGTAVGFVAWPSTVDLAALRIRCAEPDGPVTVTVDPGSTPVTLLDDGQGTDVAAADGVYSASLDLGPSGVYTVSFPGGDLVTVFPARPYTAVETPYAWETTTNLVPFGNALEVRVDPPFPILFGGGFFTSLYVHRYGSISVAPRADSGFLFESLSTNAQETLIAPYWASLYSPRSVPGVLADVVGTAPDRRLAIEWRDVLSGYCSWGTGVTTASFQVVFFEGSSRLQFNYKDVTFGGPCADYDGGATASIGVQVAPGVGTSIGYRRKVLRDGLSLLWTTPQVLTVARTGSGTGTVESSPPGIACGLDCAEAFLGRAGEVTLTATPDEGSRFVGWSGACTGGSAACRIEVAGDQTALAKFERTVPQVSLHGVAVAAVLLLGLLVGWIGRRAARA